MFISTLVIATTLSILSLCQFRFQEFAKKTAIKMCRWSIDQLADHVDVFGEMKASKSSDMGGQCISVIFEALKVMLDGKSTWEAIGNAALAVRTQQLLLLRLMYPTQFLLLVPNPPSGPTKTKLYAMHAATKQYATTRYKARANAPPKPVEVQLAPEVTRRLVGYWGNDLMPKKSARMRKNAEGSGSGGRSAGSSSSGSGC